MEAPAREEHRVAAGLPEIPAITVYAQTNLQLFNQLLRQGYSNTELTLIHNAYELAKHLFAGYFIVSGRTQIAHVVGTASILASLRLSGEIVAAGLIHNVYKTGDFGDGRRNVSRARRSQIRKAIGTSVEELVYKFPATKRCLISPSNELRPQALSAVCAHSETPDSIDRRVLLIFLAEQLDHHQNLEDLKSSGAFNAEIAERLGFPALAAELRAVARAAASAARHIEFANPGLHRSQVIVPSSYRKRARVAVRQELSLVRKRFGQLIHRVFRSLHRRSINNRT